ncbi:MAG: DNA recombination protein RmuC [Firmicutes bacterium]|nr:DNA recombination protein RmuC [Bacillota bacterium]
MDAVVIALVASVIILVIAVIYLSSRKPTGDISSLRDTLERQNMLMQEMKTYAEFGGRGQDILREELLKAQRTIDSLKTDYEARKQLEEESRQVIKRLESMIVGSYSKGQAGENILHEIFKLFPREMIAYNFSVGGKVVEFGLVLSDKKVLPIDSKWPATSLLIALEEEKDEKVRLGIVEQIEREVAKRIREVCQYIDPDVTAPWAIAAVPDAVFSACKRAYLDAYKRHVILMSYSMTIPYILTVYSLHLQYSRSVDIDNLQGHLINIGRQLDEMEQILENKVARGSTMINNAYGEYKQLISRIRASVTYLQETKSMDDLDQKALVKGTEYHIKPDS